MYYFNLTTPVLRNFNVIHCNDFGNKERNVEPEMTDEMRITATTE